MLNTANIYIDLLNKIKESGGAVPPELVAEVEALNVTVNGDETTDPPTVGLVDIVSDLGDEVEDLDIDINGDDTTEPPTPGLKDRVSDLETTINGDSSVSPVIPPLLAGAGNMRISTGWENPNPAATFAPGSVNLSSSDYDYALVVYNESTIYAVKDLAAKSVILKLIDNVAYALNRSVTLSGGSATFTNCLAVNLANGTYIDNNDYMIPIAIYLVKKMSN